jgi:hypothetical protein
MKLSPKIITSLVILATGACSRVPEPTDGAPAEPAAPAGSSEGTRARALLTSMTRRATSVDTSPRLLFQVSCNGDRACQRDPAGVAARVAAHLSLLDEEGATLPVTAAVEAVKRPAYEPADEVMVAVTPRGELDADRWYTLRLISDGGLSLSSTDVLPAEHAAAVREDGRIDVPFFTGSAPHVVGLMHPTDPRKPLSSVTVTMSEPVSLGSAASAFAVTGARGQRLAGCVWDPSVRRCADPSATMINGAFEFMFSERVEAADLADLEVRLGGELLGSGRTVAEGARAARLPPGPASTLHTTVAAADWTDCTGAGHAACYRVPPRAP